MRHNISCNVYFYSIFMSKLYACLHIFSGKIAGLCTKSVHFPTDIYGICTVKYCCF